MYSAGLGCLGLSAAGTVALWCTVVAGVWLTVRCCPGLWEARPLNRRVSSRALLGREKKHRLLSFCVKEEKLYKKALFFFFLKE